MAMLINSWTLGAMAAIGLIIVGRKKTWGWLFLVFAQMMWITYGVTTRQYGFVASGMGFAALNGYNYIKWLKADLQSEKVRDLEMTADEVPARLIKILDQKAGKHHSRSGPVVTALAEILTEYDRLQKGEAART
jgi:hypothetical protein